MSRQLGLNCMPDGSVEVFDRETGEVLGEVAADLPIASNVLPADEEERLP